MASLEHRVKLLDAIAALRNNTTGNASSVDAASTSNAASPRPEDRAERRQVTVMFSDLVGSTALSARMDPEDCARSFRPIRSPSQKPCSASMGSLRSTRAMACWSTSVTRRRMRMTRRGLCARGWIWLLQ